MTPRRHLDDLFTAAYDDELSPIDEARFQTHMQSCAPCAEAYAEFRATVEALRELPPARMPHVVHLPSTPPVAERSVRPRIGLGWFNLGIVRRFPATAIAGAAAVVILIAALAHGTGGTPTNSPQSLAHPNAAGGAASGAIPETACTQIVGITGASPPVSFTHQDLATDAAQPALHLVLAAPSLVVSAGKPAYVYAQLSLPVASLSNPGTQATTPPARAVLPCVSIAVGNRRTSSPRSQPTAERMGTRLHSDAESPQQPPPTRTTEQPDRSSPSTSRPASPREQRFTSPRRFPPATQAPGARRSRRS